jgi:hypothetical protein
MTNINVIALRQTAAWLRDNREAQSVLNFPISLAMKMEDAADEIERLHDKVRHLEAECESYLIGG